MPFNPLSRTSSMPLPVCDHPDQIRLLPLGGHNEVGMNLLVMEHQGALLLFDCGTRFADSSTPGVGRLLPEISWLHQRRADICGLLLSHGHEDHIGALPWLYAELGAPPLFGAPFTLELARRNGVAQKSTPDLDRHAVAPGETFTCGPFVIEAVSISHSIPANYGWIVRCAAGTLVHSGDFRLDPAAPAGQRTDLARLARLADEEVLVLLADSTNAGQQSGASSSDQVARQLHRQLAETPGMVVLSTFASHLTRLQQALSAARNNNRRVALLGASLIDSCALASQQGLLSSPPGLVVPPEELARLPRAQRLLLASGCQGEPQGALARLAGGAWPALALQTTDSVLLSARAIPGNELALQRLAHRIGQQGARLLTPAEIPNLHCSGHAGTTELRLLHALVRPRYLVPTHGHAGLRQQQALLAQTDGHEPGHCLLLDNGQAVRLSRHGSQRETTLSCPPRLYGPAGEPQSETALRQRRRLAHQGLLIARLRCPPATAKPWQVQLVGRGLWDAGPLAAAQLRQLTEALEQELTSVRPETPTATVEALVQRCLKYHCKRQLLGTPLLVILFDDEVHLDSQ